MAKFELLYEAYVQCQARVEVEAASLSEAAAMGARLTPGFDVFEPDLDTMTEPRLYSIAGESGTLARVRMPDCSARDAWTGVDLREQWPRALNPLPDDAESRAFENASAAHCATLPPILEDGVRAELEAERLRVTTPAALSSAPPIRK